MKDGAMLLRASTMWQDRKATDCRAIGRWEGQNQGRGARMVSDHFLVPSLAQSREVEIDASRGASADIG